MEAVKNLRSDWDELLELASRVEHSLLSQDRHMHEQEMDQQVKEFRMETIRFRNSFDTEGPLVPGLTPAVAVERLGG